MRRPEQLLRVHLVPELASLPQVPLHELGRRADHVLALLVLDELQTLERRDDVVLHDGRHVAQLLDGDGALVVLQDGQDRARPVAVVAHRPQVGKGPLRGPHLVLPLREGVREGDEKLPVALALMRRERQDARQVVVLRRALRLLGEVADRVAPALVHDAQHVEEEEVHVVVQCLVVEEELGEVAQVLAVDLLLLAVDLEVGQGHRVAVPVLVRVPVDLVPRGVQLRDLLHVPLQLLLALEEAEVEFAEVELRHAVVLGREGREVPGVHLPLAQVDALDVLQLGELLVLPQRLRVELLVLVVRVFVDLPLLVARAPAGLSLLRLAVHRRVEVHPLQRDPLVQPPVEL